jgi:DNA-binding SARP family transcriptional activator/Tfp pilus assembly protein PilF
MAVEFRLLGSVEVRSGGRSLDIGPARQQSVLGVLLLDANRCVSADQLVERVWGHRRLPDRPHSAVQTYVSLLRRALADVGQAAIERQQNGYVIRLDERLVDLYAFQDTVKRAHAAEDDARAEALFGEALALWRGEVCEPLDTPWLSSVRAAMNKERVAAERDLTDVQLRQGQHTALLARLSEWAERQPLDERLAGQLMVALFRSGRQADALRHYQRVCQQLADELAIGPGRALRRLHQQILADDAALAAPTPPHAPAAVTQHAEAGRPRPPVPRQLPAAPRFFTGRVEQLAFLTEALATHVTTPTSVLVVAVGGIGGVGKTWLALHWAHRHLDRFPDGQLYVDLHGFDLGDQPTSPADALRAFLDALGVEPSAVPAGLDAQIGLYRSLTASRRMLIVLDNAADTAQVTPLLPGGPACTVLVTSRRRLTGLAVAHGAQILDLDVLSGQESWDALARRVGDEQLAEQRHDAAELLEYCAGLPLAISVVAARARAHPSFPLSVLAAELRDQTSRLDTLEDQDGPAGLHAVLAWSFNALTPRAATALQLLASAPGQDLNQTAAEALTALPAARTRVVLRELDDLHLLHQYAPGRYRMHDLVRLYAADRASSTQSADELTDALHRLVGFSLRTALAADRLLDPHRPAIEAVATPECRTDPLQDAAEALAWFNAEHANLLAVQRLAAARGWDAAAWQLAWALDTFHWRRGHLYHALEAWRCGLAAGDRLGDPAARILVRRRLGHACALVGLHDEALERLYEALKLARDTDDVTSQAHIQHSLAWAWEQRGDDRRALEHAAAALPHYRTLDMPAWEARELNAVGWYHARLGEYDQARTHCEAALELCRQHANRPGEANTLDSLGYVEQRTGRFEHARDHYVQALAILRELGHTYQEANTLDQLGHTHVALGQAAEARAAWQRAHMLYQDHSRSADAERVSRQLDALFART